jgi:hypothetical protein
MLQLRLGVVREMTMPRQVIGLTAMMAIALGLASGPAFAQGIQVTGAGAAVYPTRTTFMSVPVSGLQLGIGVRIPGNGTALGQFQVTLVGTSVLGLEQDIEVEGQATTGSATAGSAATFSGTVRIDMGDGTPPLAGVAFTLTIATNAEGQGTLTLTLGSTTLPVFTVSGGSISMR